MSMRRSRPRHVQDATSLLGARYRQKPFLLLDDDGQFFVGPLHRRSVHAVYLDREMKRLVTAEIALANQKRDPPLRAFFARVMASLMH